VTVSTLESNLECFTLVKNLLEPKLVDLMDSDKQKLIVLGTIRQRRLKF
jgi:hypothetical protein